MRFSLSTLMMVCLAAATPLEATIHVDDVLPTAGGGPDWSSGWWGVYAYPRRQRPPGTTQRQRRQRQRLQPPAPAMKRIPLVDLDGEVTRVQLGSSGQTVPCVLFLCPVCLEANGGARTGVHSHLVRYEPGASRNPGVQGGVHVWGNPSGSTVA